MSKQLAYRIKAWSILFDRLPETRGVVARFLGCSTSSWPG
jgi:hypothetical protein